MITLSDNFDEARQNQPRPKPLFRPNTGNRSRFISSASRGDVMAAQLLRRIAPTRLARH